MQMIALLLIVACVAGSTEPDCKRHVLPIKTTIEECVNDGPALAAAWETHHPDVEVRGWACLITPAHPSGGGGGGL